MSVRPGKIETDLGKIRAGEKYYDLGCAGDSIIPSDSKFLNFLRENQW
ncbi:MAG: hypothetical protein M3213_02205 [Thermoproteota archaeon]|nr:hypothetical protein [Thermoproteota archaeon]